MRSMTFGIAEFVLRSFVITDQKYMIMDKETLNEIGKAFDLDQTSKAYEFGGKNVYWTDYTFDWFNDMTESEQMKYLDNAWDEDAYYNDFDKWWCSLSFEEQDEIYNKMNNQ